jgi:arabinogalactan oligomer/maltooligosaccharide transport system permease protein
MAQVVKNPRDVSTAGKVGIYIVLTLFSLFALFPIVQVFTISLRPSNQLFSTSLEIIPDGATVQNYVSIFTKHPFLKWIFNSLLVSLAVTLVSVGMASTAGYAFSRYKFIGRDSGMILLIATQMFPVTMLLLPLFIMLIKLGIYDSYSGLIVAYTATALPFCIWQMKGFYDTIPRSLEEAARIDGCTELQTFWKVIFPLAQPALVITALFSFMTAWSEYLVAAVLIQDPSLFTLPMGLKAFQSDLEVAWGLYSASAIVVSIPVVFLFVALSRYLVSGLTLGSVKE